MKLGVQDAKQPLVSQAVTRTFKISVSQITEQATHPALLKIIEVVEGSKLFPALIHFTRKYIYSLVRQFLQTC